MIQSIKKNLRKILYWHVQWQAAADSDRRSIKHATKKLANRAHFLGIQAFKQATSNIMSSVNDLNISGLLLNDDDSTNRSPTEIYNWKLGNSAPMPAADVATLIGNIKTIFSEDTPAGEYYTLVAMPNNYLTAKNSKSIEDAAFAEDAALLIASKADTLVINKGTKLLVVHFVMAWMTGKDRTHKPALYSILDESNASDATESKDANGGDVNESIISGESSHYPSSETESNVAANTSGAESSFDSVGQVGFTQECFF